MTALLTLSFALGQSLLVASMQDCPAPGAVDARVREILGLRGDDVLEERATIVRDGASLRVTLRGKDDRVLTDRSLQADGSCDELAGAVAVVLAASISDVHPEYVGAMPENPAAPPAAAPSSPAPVADAATKPARDSKTERSHHWLVGAALGADLSSAAAVPLAALSLRFIPKRSGFGAALAATVVGERTAQLSSGGVRYFRWPLLIGPALRLPVASAQLDLHAGAALGWLHLAGVDFSPPLSHEAFLGGGFVSTRVSLGSGTFVPFAEASGVLWRSTEAFVQRGPEERSVSLPSLELYVALGATWQAW